MKQTIQYAVIKMLLVCVVCGLCAGVVSAADLKLNIDENMGLLMQKLDQWDLANDTLLIFMTDNGSSAGTYNCGMKGKKGSVNEGGARVPLFFRWPGRIQAGVEVDRLARHTDLFPTLAEFAHADLPAGYALDGRSLKPLIANPEAPWSDRFAFFHKGRWKKKGAPNQWGRGNTDPDQARYTGFAVRSERWRLVGKEALYDIDQDPGERHNVAADHPEVVAKMLAAYDQWWAEVRPMMVNEDATLDTGKPFVIQFERQKKESGIPQWKPRFND